MKFKKIARKLLAGVFALSLAVTSLPVISNTALAEATAAKSKPLMNMIGKVDDYYFLWLYCNDETGTAFTFSGREVPVPIKDLLMESNTFEKGLKWTYTGENWLKWYSFPDAEITARDYFNVGADPCVYDVVNYGDIIYTDEAGEAHTFTCLKDVEDYVIQTYDVDLLDIDEIPEEDLPWVALSKPSPEPPTPTETTTRKERIDWIGYVDNPNGETPYNLYSYDNDETGTSFTFCGNDMPTFLLILLNESDSFNYGDVVYTDEAGEAHTFTCVKDVEDYLIQSNLVTLVSGGDTTTTTAPVDVLIGDVTLDGKVDLIDAIYLNKICSNIIAATDMQEIAGDCNADGTVNDMDVAVLMEFCIGLQQKLPVTV